MKPFGYLAKHSIVAAATIVFVSSFLSGQTVQPVSNEKPTAREFNLLVVGDSILWGQGLKEEHKSWYQIKTWLQEMTGREVRQQIQAHSGAMIGSASDPRANLGTRLDGEVSRAVPTVNEQVDDAVKSYAEPSQVDLVLVDGCINDIGARRLLNAASTQDGVRELAQAKCGSPVEALLSKITSSFPNAHVVVTGYYPIISDRTPNDLFTRALAKRFYTPAAGDRRMNDKQLLARLIAISQEWYQVSSDKLAAAAASVDAQLTARGSHQRVLFAAVSLLPEHSFEARQSRLWGFDASALRRLLAVFTLGRVTLRTNDERERQRSASCRQVYKRPAEESTDQKKTRESLLTLCRVAALGHPNRKGALMYTESINRQLKLLITNPGWLREARPTATSGNPNQ